MSSDLRSDLSSPEQGEFARDLDVSSVSEASYRHWLIRYWNGGEWLAQLYEPGSIEPLGEQVAASSDEGEALLIERAQRKIDAIEAQKINATEPEEFPASSKEMAVDHSNHVRLAADEFRDDTLTGATVYGPEDSKIGSVSHVHGSGPAAKVVIDVGGFLGIGAKPVLIPASDLDFMRDEEGEIHAVTTWTKEELQNMPEHKD